MYVHWLLPPPLFPSPQLKAPCNNLPRHIPIVYKAGLGTGYLELPQVPLVAGRLEKALLKTKDVYILDFYTDIFVWWVICVSA